MARLPRLALGGHLHLVMQRGHGGAPVFLEDADYELYLRSLQQAAREHHVLLHAYAVLPERVLLLVTPSADDSLGRMLQSLGRRFGAALNRRRGRAGALWDGRFRGALIDADTCLLDCIRFVEEAPARAGLAAEPIDYRWSSAAHHGGRRRDALVTEHALYWRMGNTPFDREARHRHLLEDRLDEALHRRIGQAVEKCWGLGSQAFLRDVASSVDRPLGPRARGRPRKSNVAGAVAKKSVPD